MPANCRLTASASHKGIGRTSKSSVTSAHTRFTLSPPRIAPRFSVGQGTPERPGWSKSGSGFICIARSSVLRDSINTDAVLRAFTPWRGSDECAALPVMTARSPMKPLCPKMGVNSVGSPTTTSEGAAPAAFSHGAAARAPCMDVSSSQVTRSARPFAGIRPATLRRCIRAIAAAMNPFMSQEPKP